MTDTPETPAETPHATPLTPKLFAALEQQGDFICRTASEYNGQAMVAIGDPDGEGGLKVRITYYAGADFLAAIVRKLAEGPDAARALDRQRIQSMLDSIVTSAPAAQSPQGRPAAPSVSEDTDGADAPETAKGEG